MLTQIFHLHALTALHVGAGQALGVVDLPLARARATHLPLVPGSALKGVLRDEFAGNARQKTRTQGQIDWYWCETGSPQQGRNGGA